MINFNKQETKKVQYSMQSIVIPIEDRMCMNMKMSMISSGVKNNTKESIREKV